MAPPPQSEVKSNDTWSSLAMKRYGDALLGLRLAEANGVTTSTPPAQLADVHFPPVEELDPDRLRSGPVADDLFADDDASVVKEAKYRLVMAMGGSGAVNAAPASVSSKPAVKSSDSVAKKRATANKRDLSEGLGAIDGQALVLDVKASRHQIRPEQKTTKDDLHKEMSARDGKELILEVKAGAHSRTPGDEHLGDSLAAKDGRAYIIEVKAATKRPKPVEIDADGNEHEVETEEPKGPPMGERFGDEIAKIDGKALILETRAHNKRKETKEQIAAKKKHKATAKLYSELADRDGKELILDVRAQVKDEEKFDRLKERRSLAKKRKRRTGLGSLIPKDWQATGSVSADDIEDYIDEMRENRESEAELYGESEEDTAAPFTTAKAARLTAHRSEDNRHASFLDEAEEEIQHRPSTEGVGAFEEMQQQRIDHAPMPTEQRTRRKRERKLPRAADDAGTAQLIDAAALPSHPQMAKQEVRPILRPKPRPQGQAQSQPPVQGQSARPDAPAPHPQMPRMERQVRADRPQALQAQIQAQKVPSVSDWDDDEESKVKLPGTQVSDWDDDDSMAQFTGMTGLSGITGLSDKSNDGSHGRGLPVVSAEDPYAPEAMARLCMLSPGTVMQVARTAPVGAGPVLELVGHLREAKTERDQGDLMRKFINQHADAAMRTLELLLSS